MAHVRLSLDCTPVELLRAWPANQQVVLLHSGGGVDAGQSGGELPEMVRATAARWSIFAAPASNTYQGWPEALQAARPNDGLIDAPDAVPFDGGWIGWLGYDLGFDLEPAARRGDVHATDDRHWPVSQWANCPSALVYDHWRGGWLMAGEQRGAERLAMTAVQAVGAWRKAQQRAAGEARTGFALGRLSSGTGRGGYLAAVKRALEHIGAGDIYQVNLAHRLSGNFEGSSRELHAALAAGAGPWYGAYIEAPGGAMALEMPMGSDEARQAEVHTRVARSKRAVCCVSPELFLAVSPSGAVVTRPMKGTRRVDGSAEPARELEMNEKERAELTMITDLMRSDLGRVCVPGSIKVSADRTIERHGGEGQVEGGGGGGGGGVWQATATVRGQLGHGVSLAGVLKAAFPGGSITGAPKVRAMQIIDALEPTARGPYCGCVGFVSRSGHAAFAMTIRTALISTEAEKPKGPSAFAGATLDYWVGAGIVADSVPEAEWEETLAKAGVIARLAEGGVVSERGVVAGGGA